MLIGIGENKTYSIPAHLVTWGPSLHFFNTNLFITGSLFPFIIILYQKLFLTFAVSHCSCDKVYHKREVRFLLYFLGQIVTWQYHPNLLD